MLRSRPRVLANLNKKVIYAEITWVFFVKKQKSFPIKFSPFYHIILIK